MYYVRMFFSFFFEPPNHPHKHIFIKKVRNICHFLNVLLLCTCTYVIFEWSLKNFHVIFESTSLQFNNYLNQRLSQYLLCTTLKKVWETAQKHGEGGVYVRKSKLYLQIGWLLNLTSGMSCFFLLPPPAHVPPQAEFRATTDVCWLFSYKMVELKTTE